MENCIFCKIVKGESPCAEVFSGERVLAFLDIGPIAPGHTLVVPKAHYLNLWEVPADLAAELLTSMQTVGRALMQATQATGMNVVMNNFSSAGQVVMHAHWHLIPRFEGDGLFQVEQQPYASREALYDMAAAMQQALEH